ncbi:MAG: endonuclease, partial [Nitrosopumilus sp.]|nr:endonuclease [Nitrosopumilus sp.]
MIIEVIAISSPIEEASDRYNKRKKERVSNLDSISKEHKDASNIENRDRIRTRRSLINPNDKFALERITGKSDLLPINYLQIGIEVSQSVCRIQVKNESGILLGYGTGFM